MKRRIIIKDFDFQGFRIKKDDIVIIEDHLDIALFYVVENKVSLKVFNYILDIELSKWLSKSKEIEV